VISVNARGVEVICHKGKEKGFSFIQPKFANTVKTLFECEACRLREINGTTGIACWMRLTFIESLPTYETNYV
jgi:hypothetical protein